MSSALAQAEILSILSRYVFSTHTFLLICDFSCLNLPGMVLRGGPKAIVWTENEKIVYPNLHVDRNWWIFSSVFQTFATS